MDLFYCTSCGVVMHDPQEARTWTEIELLNLFKHKSDIPVELRRSRALFVGMIPKPGGGTMGAFVSEETEGFQKTEAKREEDQRLATCWVCKCPRLFSPVELPDGGSSWQT